MQPALKGVTVLDITFYLPGPYAAGRLAGMGADVVKIEPPGGDPAVRLGGMLHEAVNSNKRIMSLNLKSDEGKKRLLGLIGTADILIESFRPGVMRSLGFDYGTARKIKPDLIYCSLSGYGQQGPLSDFGSHDLNYLALSGALMQMAGKDKFPCVPTTTFADYAGGLLAAEQLIAALYRRAKTGEGAYLDVAPADVPAEFQQVHDRYAEAGISYTGIPGIDGSRACYSIYETQDRKYVALAALEEKFWHRFCEEAGEAEWRSAAAAPPGSPIYEEIAAYFKTKTRDEWTAFSLRTDCCLSPVLEAHERIHHPYFAGKEKTI